ncbi:ComEC/Rec2 family competence protein [Massilia oculi]|uniref:Metallo-beta-lactamase domain-containing protein n=1 Tax=Massilia oculi TaxID=945844 RepID=A0A2S2DDV0_9BURK|nr:MBL fold metallo-hydrolase [Massilia oculi]AWL03518.1 hypothetical protein DIR46_03015 [Massilia oculi]
MAAPNDRRRLLLGALLPLALGPSARAAPAAPASVPAPERAGAALAPWQPGWLDIHHIATGRGNATLVMLPDGTSMLIDAGASFNEPEVSVAPRPNASRRPGEWMGRYVRRHLGRAGLEGLDYLLTTHLHPDHTGDADAATPLAPDGAFRLSGVTDVAAQIAIGTVVDRGYPDYDFPARIAAPFADNYRAFIADRRKAGLRVEAFRVGSNEQFAGRAHRATASSFEVRNIAANGVVWTGTGSATRQLFPPLETLARADWPSENACSAAIRIASGRFRYFTAGDLTSYTHDGALPWHDVLGPAARAAGPVSVATADHHGMFDGLNPEVVRTLRPRAWVIPSWHIAHPDMLQLERMFSERLYPGPRAVFATTVMRENLLANGRLTRKLHSHDGHVVVRVAPDGESFYVAVTDNGAEDDKIKLVTEQFMV